MTFQANPEAIPFFVAAAIAAGVAFFATRRRATPMTIAFTMMMAGESAWALFEALELVFADLETKKLCFTLRATGSVTAVLSLLATVLIFTRRDSWLRPPRIVAVYAVPVLLLAAAWTNPWHHLYWTRLWNAQIGGHWIAMPVYGPLFTAHFFYCYSLVGISSCLLARAVYQSAGVYRSQAAVMLFGVLLPWVVNILDMTRLFGFIYVDSAAIGFASDRSGVYSRAGTLPAARPDAGGLGGGRRSHRRRGRRDRSLGPDRRVLNPAAQRLIGRPEADVVGRPVTQAFTSWRALAKHLEGPANASSRPASSSTGQTPLAVAVI